MGDAPMDHTKERYCTPSWVFGYFAIAQLPLTIVGPINATRPVMTLVGAMLVFGERLNCLAMGWCQSGYYFPVSIGKER